MTETHYRDNFEGRWHSDHLPLGDLANEMTLDIADGKVDVVIDDNPVGGGDYHLDKDVMVLGWSVEWYGIDFQLLDATLASEDDMLLRWKPSDFWYPYTTVYKRN